MGAVASERDLSSIGGDRIEIGLIRVRMAGSRGSKEEDGGVEGSGIRGGRSVLATDDKLNF